MRGIGKGEWLSRSSSPFCRAIQVHRSFHFHGTLTFVRRVLARQAHGHRRRVEQATAGTAQQH